MKNKKLCIFQSLLLAVQQRKFIFGVFLSLFNVWHLFKIIINILTILNKCAAHLLRFIIIVDTKFYIQVWLY